MYIVLMINANGRTIPYSYRSRVYRGVIVIRKKREDRDERKQRGKSLLIVKGRVWS